MSASLAALLTFEEWVSVPANPNPQPPAQRAIGLVRSRAQEWHLNPARIGVLTGPNLAREVLAGQPTASVIAMAGNLANFEEASRALFADDRRRFTDQIASWPADIRDHVVRLAYSDHAE